MRDLVTQPLTEYQDAQRLRSGCPVCVQRFGKSYVPLVRMNRFGEVDDFGNQKYLGSYMVCSDHQSDWHSHYYKTIGNGTKRVYEKPRGLKLPSEGPTPATRADVMPIRRKK